MQLELPEWRPLRTRFDPMGGRKPWSESPFPPLQALSSSPGEEPIVRELMDLQIFSIFQELSPSDTER
eukprot:2394313-Prymnesium_polylepis.1